MQVNLMQMLLANSLKLSSRFDSFEKYTYSQTWPKNINNLMTKHFLTFKQFYLRAFRCVQSLSVEFFEDVLSLKILSPFWKTILSFIKNHPSKGLFR